MSLTHACASAALCFVSRVVVIRRVPPTVATVAALRLLPVAGITRDVAVPMLIRLVHVGIHPVVNHTHCCLAIVMKPPT